MSPQLIKRLKNFPKRKQKLHQKKKIKSFKTSIFFDKVKSAPKTIILKKQSFTKIKLRRTGVF